MEVVYICKSAGCLMEGQESVGDWPYASNVRDVSEKTPPCFVCKQPLEYVRGAGGPEPRPDPVRPVESTPNVPEPTPVLPKRMHKKVIEEELRAVLSGSSDLSIEAMMLIYSHQTSREQASRDASEQNGVGFTKFDAEIMTSFSVQYLARTWLSEKQREIAKKRMPKYAHQIMRLGKEHLFLGARTP